MKRFRFRLASVLSLRELAERRAREGFGQAQQAVLKAEWFEGRARVGLTAGASAPDVLVQAVIARLRELGAVAVRTLPGVQETMKFPLPKGLKAEHEGAAD